MLQAIAAAVLLTTTAPHWHETSPTLDQAPAYRIYLDLPGFLLSDALPAVRNWARALRGWRRLEVVDKADKADLIIDEITTNEAAYFGIVDSHVIAFANHIGGSRIHMIVDRYEFDVGGILAHEMGHTFGAEHVEGTIMRPIIRADQANCPDAYTISQVALYQGIDFARLGYCWR